MKFLKVFIGCLLLKTGIAKAIDTTSYSTAIHHHYQSPRALGMGDAFVAVANDYSALFYNPAGLAYLDENDLNMSFDFAGTPAIADLMTDLDEAQGVTGSDATKQAAVAEVLEKNYGKRFGMRVGAPQAIWARPGWAVGVIPLDLTMRLSVHNTVGPAVNTSFYADTTLAYGYGQQFKDFEYGRLAWGATAKFVHRGYFAQNIQLIELASDPNLVSEDDLSSGLTADVDLGFLWSPSIPEEGIFSILEYTRPTFGLVVRNVGELGFQSSGFLGENNNSKPEKLYRVVDLGSRWEYPSFLLFSGRGVLDVRDILHPNFSLEKGLHIGFEFDWTMASWWKGQYRVGMSQGFWTAGASAMFTIFNLDLVSYADNVGSKDQPIENRFYMLRASLNF